MRVLSIIPVKDLGCTKTRLRSILHLPERQILTLQLLDRTLNILRDSKKVEKVVVLSPDPRVLSFAKKLGVPGLRERRKGLNEALKYATLWAIDNDFEALLILPSDIPLLNKDDIEAIISMGLKKGKTIVLAPDREMRGTNALFIKPPGILEYSYGFESFLRHRSQALTQNIDLKVYHSRSVAFDLDYPEHYRFLLENHYFKGKTADHEDKLYCPHSNQWDTSHTSGR